MPVAPPLQRFVDDELARAPRLIEQVRVAAVERLQRAVGRDALTPHELHLRQDAAQALQLQAGRFTAQFVDALRSLVQADLAGPERAAQVPAAGASAAEQATETLALMDESLVESDIEVSRAAMLIDSAVEWEQRELQAFTSALRGEAHVGTDSNPLRPALLARALWQATAALALPSAPRLLALHEAASAIGGPLKQAYAAACSRIEAGGIEPSPYRTVLLAPGSVADAGTNALRRAHGELDRPGALRGLLARMPAGARGSAGAPGSTVSAGLPGSVGAPGAPELAASAAVSVSVEQALARLGALTRRAGPASLAGDGAAGVPVGERAALAAQAPQGIDQRLIELLSRLFDAILADPALPAPAKGALARLQVSALRVALRDEALLETDAHPTWRLLDRIASACQQAAAAGPARLAALAAACEGLADELARHATPDAALYRHALVRLDALVADDLRQAQQAAHGAISALQRTDRRLRIQAQVQARLEGQFLRSPVGPAVRRCLLGAWAQRLAETILESGPEGEATAALTRTVDDLLWSLNPPAHPASRQRLVRLLPGLLTRLRAGMAQCGLAEGERQAVLDELEAAHTAKLWPVGAAAAAAPDRPESPEDIVRRLREETEDAAPPRREFGDSVLDLSMLDTVPAELLPDDAQPGRDEDRAHRAQAAVAALAAGDAARLLLQGHWHDAQLLWRSDGGELLLFADTTRRTRALTRRALERLHFEGLAHLDPPGSLIRRAVAGVFADLARP